MKAKGAERVQIEDFSKKSEIFLCFFIAIQKVAGNVRNSLSVVRCLGHRGLVLWRFYNVPKWRVLTRATVLFRSMGYNVTGSKC
jgi:hypothetical protein